MGRGIWVREASALFDSHFVPLSLKGEEEEYFLKEQSRSKLSLIDNL
tara:strand:- start:55 stop:195 length:141 start_codon:yes stop_codon:yes gene_type:complete